MKQYTVDVTIVCEKCNDRHRTLQNYIFTSNDKTKRFGCKICRTHRECIFPNLPNFGTRCSWGFQNSDPFRVAILYVNIKSI